MSETDQRMPDPKSDVPQEGEIEDSQLLKLTGQQKALFDSLSEREKGLHEKPIRLASVYLGSLAVLENEGNPDRMAQAAHSIRELMEKIPAIVDVKTKAMQESLKSKVRNLEDYWEKLKKAISFNGKTWNGKLNGIGEKLLEKLHEFFEWFNDHHKRRKAEIDETFCKLEGSELILPPPLRQLNVNYWDLIRDYFQAIAHHRRETTLEEFKAYMAALEKFLLDRLSPRTFGDFNELDQIIEEGESNDQT